MRLWQGCVVYPLFDGAVWAVQGVVVERFHVLGL